ncbi:Highly reducing polyketide synthase sdnO [Penicillium subrubescens]|uniref:Lovastatin diketide synthase LovF n=1 Tax=Penicillium subrubescens TaxID=1316194 RepID=A0A1Q5UGT7_9EURO|nr:Highly reducing polyketide synthase sdnO [Penicillium subrubescens]KAJ5896473.1 Highly reducing polyketide synthase sdnO [Penicillium subrubescens]OKP11696.1 Lovastatin diketide synthase LovF [Penicillium subrubescens]
MSELAPIAVIGMGCRLPGGASSPEKLWEMLAEGRSGWGEVPAERWNWKSFYHPHNEAKESLNSKSGYFLDQDIGAFDAKFFNIASYEAHAMDPQQRILLETTYEALENAGISLDNIKGSNTCVYVGLYARDYDRMGFKDLPQITKLHITGTGEAVVSNRISYLFDLKGASVTVDTGCSGSMVALHQACQNLRTGESNMAIVGGTQLLLHPDQAIAMSTVGMVNPHGRCFVFDSRGSGYARGEGVGTIVLKRLDDAIAAGDPVHAVIRNSGLNQDGKTAGISLPNPDAQAALMKWVYSSAGVDPRNTVYVEAHGTGTQAGDNAEISSINQVFCEEAGRKSDIYVGSVKSNIGHLEASSGIAGLIKGIMIVKKGFIPPNLDLETPKPSLKLDERKIKIPVQLTPLPEPEQPGPSRVSLNSFGYGGTNAHVILEPAPAVHLNGSATNGVQDDLEVKGISNGVEDGAHQPNGNGTHASFDEAPQANPQLFILSATSEKSLVEAAKNVQSWISTKASEEDCLSDLAYTLNVRRSLLPLRLSVVASTPDELVSALESKNLRITKLPHSVSVAFVFTGQGAQWYAMGRELLSISSAFKDSILQSDKLIQSFGSEWSLVEELSKDEQSSRVSDSELSQPLTTAIQVALVDLLATLGVTPQYVCGHSSGEIGAAYAAGALTLEAAIEIAYRRGLCSTAAKKANSTKGSMLAVGVGEAEVLPYIRQVQDGLVTVACVNSPDSTTISGDEAGIDELSTILNDQSIFNRKLKVDTAYHSHHMKKIADQYLESLQHVHTGTPRSNVTFYSSVVGEKKVSNFGPQYWTDNLVSKVRFSDAMKLLAEDMARSKSSSNVANFFAEIGPHGALSGPIRQIMAKLNIKNFKFTYASAFVRNKHALQSVLELTGKLFESGCGIEFEKILALHKTKKWTAIGDLSPYPWDHSLSYWYESRLSRDHRLRQFPYHDLLGLWDVGSTIHEPRWRYHLNVDALPWLRHHVVDGFMIFPGTGYICMAIEAMKQIFQLRKTPGQITKFHLKNVVLSKPIIVPDQRPDSFIPDVEVQLTLSRMKTNDGSRWETFRVFSYSPEGSGSWNEHCSGQITVDMDSKVDEVEGTREEEFLVSSYKQKFEDIQQACHFDATINPQKFYNDLRESGNDFGSTFTCMTEMQLGRHQGWAKVEVPDVPACMPRQFLQPHVIHPSLLDSLNHLAVVLFKKECSNAPLMATFFGDIIIAADITSTPADELIVALEMNPEGVRSASGNTYAFQQKEDGERSLVLHVTDWQLKAVGEAQANNGETPFHRKMSYRMHWQPDVSFLNPKQLTVSAPIDEKPLIATTDASEDLKIAEKLTFEQIIALNERAAVIYIREALAQVSAQAESVTAPHLARLFDWMKASSESEVCKSMIKGLSALEEELILQKSLISGLEGLMLSRIGLNLASLLNGETDAIELMQEDSLVSRFYVEDLFSQSHQYLVKYLKSIVYKKPHMKILAIGAGMEDGIATLLRAIDRPEGLMVDHFYLADSSSTALERAKPLLQDWAHSMEFKVLDLDNDLKDQGFEVGGYDMVIAANTLYSVKNVATALNQVHQLMKPGGKLAMVELIRPPTLAIETIFGVLSGWWAAEDNRQSCPLLSESQWHDLLLESSFSGTDIVMNENEGPKSRSAMIVSTALGQTEMEKTVSSQCVKLLSFNRWCPAFTKFAEDLSSALSQRGLDCSTSTLNPKAIEQGTTYIILDDVENALLLSPSSDEFEALKTLFITSRSLLWISGQEKVTQNGTAAKGLINGMARVARRENEGVKFITIDIQQDLIGSTSEITKQILDIAESSFWPPSETEQSHEHEFAIQNDIVMIPRVQPDTKFNEWIDRVVGDDRLDTLPYHQSNRSLKLHVETPGLLSSLRFVEDDSLALPMRADEIEIEAKAYGVNFKDVFIALGQMLPGVNMIGEVAGVVTAVGSAMQGRFNVGDRVAGVGAQPFTSRARVKGLMSCRLPESVTFTVGASIPIIYMTAYHCIVEVARLRKGQSILIHAASGGVGQAAIQFAQHIGAEIFATVGSAAKRQLLIDHYNIPEDHIFSTRSRSFKHGILRLTGDKGVDVVLNSLSGEWLNDSWECVARLGTFVEIGKTDIYKRSHLSMAPFDRSITFAAVDLVVLFETQIERMNDEFQTVMGMFESGILTPVAPVTAIPVSNIEEAFRLIASRKHTGKVVVEAESDALVKAVIAKPEPLQLDPSGSYVVAGGLGDLGKRICRLLAIHGAKHIVTLSRRSLSDEDRQAFEADMAQLGATLHIVMCDIIDESYMAEAASICQESLPPVKGVIHAGMVLRDHPLELMTPDDYLGATKPKTQGTLNLHSSFQGPALDFFITLSSITCIVGKTGQANYSAGNAFQDAFAHAHAGKSHTRYISLNLGAIDGSDAITSLPIRQQELMRQGAILVKFEELFKVLEYAMGPQAALDECVQSIMGFDRQSMETVQDTFGLSNPMFSQVPYLSDQNSSGDGASDKVDTEKAIRNSATIAEAEEIITHAIAEKFALFMDRAIEDVNLDQSLAAFGLDSLVSIELKNWMVRTFHVTLQTSEIADALSVVALAKTITLRSKLISDELRGTPASSDETEEAPVEQAAVEEASGPNHSLECCRYAKDLPKQPLMDLDEALGMISGSTRHFATEEEYTALCQAIETFGQPGSTGRQLYEKLVTMASDPKVDNWMVDFLTDATFLRKRFPLVPLSSFFATHHDAAVPHPQAERAALIATTAFRFKEAVDAGTLEPHWYFHIPSCMDSWQWLFNTTREPQLEVDVMRQYPGNDYCVVLRRGHVFKVALKNGTEPVSYATIKSQFDEILKNVQDEGFWTSILTNDNRDSWATIRETLISMSDTNAECIRVIEQALFVICLDNGAPTTSSDRIRKAYLGDGFNRWNDKGLQFIIFENGSSGYQVEHTMIDGLTVHRMNEWIHESIRSHIPNQDHTNGTSNGIHPTLEEYTLTTTPSIDSHILAVRNSHLQTTSSREYSYLTLSHFGKDFLARHGCPIKSVFDVTIQLASNLYFGHNPASWEPMSMAHFHKGRTEIFQGVLPSVAQFCTTATDTAVPAVQRREMLIRAANEYTAGLQNSGKGNNYFRLMTVLEGMWPVEEEELAPLFRDPVWLRTYPRFIMSGLTDGGSLDSAFALVDPEGVWICYSIGENEARFSIVGPVGKVSRFEEVLDEATALVKTLVESS